MVQQWSVLSGFIQFHTASLPVCVNASANRVQLNAFYMNITKCACVCACLCVHGHVNTWPPVSHKVHLQSLSLFVPRVLQSLETFPFNPKGCNWSHV